VSASFPCPCTCFALRPSDLGHLLDIPITLRYVAYVHVPYPADTVPPQEVWTNFQNKICGVSWGLGAGEVRYVICTFRRSWTSLLSLSPLSIFSGLRYLLIQDGLESVCYNIR